MALDSYLLGLTGLDELDPLAAQKARLSRIRGVPDELFSPAFTTQLPPAEARPTPAPAPAPAAAAPAPAPTGHVLPKSLTSMPTSGQTTRGTVSTDAEAYRLAQEADDRGEQVEIKSTEGASKRSDDFDNIMAEIKRLQGERPDPAELTRYAGEREDKSNRRLALGLAMQSLGGQAFAPAGGHILQQALKEGGDYEIPGGWGVATPTGVTWNPEKQREQSLKALEFQAQQLRQKQQHEAALAATEEAKRRHDQTLIAMAGARGAQAGERRDDARASQIDRVGGQVMDDYIKAVKDERIILSAYDNLKATAKRTDAASDISFIFQYMKMLDPTSVVREGEFATAQNAAGIPDRIRNAYNKAMQGTLLNPTQRSEFLGTADRLSKAAELRMLTRQKEFEPRLRAVGADPAIYIPGYRAPGAGAPDVTLPPNVTVTRER